MKMHQSVRALLLAGVTMMQHSPSNAAQAIIGTEPHAIRLEVPKKYLQGPAVVGEGYLVILVDPNDLKVPSSVKRQVGPIRVEITAIKKLSRVARLLHDAERLANSNVPAAPRLVRKESSFDVYEFPNARVADRGQQWRVKKTTSGDFLGIRDAGGTSPRLQMSRELQRRIELRYQLDRQSTEQVEAVDAAIVALVQSLILN